MAMSVPVLAGTISTILFVASYLPMLVKAVRTKDLASYSLGNLVIANLGNAVHSVYVYSLPIGPIWFLHTFYLVATACMLFWHRRYARRPRPADGSEAGRQVPDGESAWNELPLVDAAVTASGSALART